jgi:ABC-type nitrate/sulfonate/bicarbonate transport system ATPase subunit
MTTLGGFAPMKKFLELWSVGKTFGHQAVVEQFSLTMPKGEFVSIIGHSGCGKSTVLSMVAGLTPSDAGAIILDNREVTGPGADRGVVFQSPSLFPWMTAQENVLLSVTAKQPRLTAKARREIADECLRLVGLEHALGRRPAELSAGMRWRERSLCRPSFSFWTSRSACSIRSRASSYRTFFSSFSIERDSPR